jgi:hypothetical protein
MKDHCYRCDTDIENPGHACERWVGDDGRVECGDRIRKGARRLCGNCANTWARAGGPEPRGCGCAL